MLDVVVPAGGEISAAYAERIGTPWRALAPLGPDRTPVMQRVVQALRDSGCVRHVIGVAPPPVQEIIMGVDKWLPSGDSGPRNIGAGLALLPDPNAPALVCTSDLPLLTGDHVRALVELAQADADVTLGLVGRAAYEAAFPGSPMSVFVPFRDVGPVTMACLFQVRPRVLARNAVLLEHAFRARKSQWDMAALLGLPLVCRFAGRRLTLAAVQARTEQLLHCRGNVVLNCPAELSYDMDSADDYAYADACLSQASAPKIVA